jgi:hypothetical protein
LLKGTANCLNLGRRTILAVEERREFFMFFSQRKIKLKGKKKNAKSKK